MTRSSRWRVRSAILALAIAAAGCQLGSESAQVILAIESDLRTPYEIDRLMLHVSTPEGRGLMPAAEQMDLGPRKLVFPAQIGLVWDRAVGSPIQIRLWALNHELRHEPVVSRVLLLPNVPEGTTHLEVELATSCARRTCPARQTCVPGLGCTRPEVDGKGQVVYPPMHKDCDCNSLFPLCVGSQFEYEICAVRSGFCYPKRWVIADEGDFFLPGSGGARERGFLQSRESEIENSKRWITRDAQDLVYYRLYEVYNARWKLQHYKVYTPGRLRVDDGARGRTFGQTWQFPVTEQEFTPGGILESTKMVTEAWTVMTVEEALAKYRDEARYFPKVLMTHPRREQIVCQERATLRDNNISAIQVYCYMPGVGKVFEIVPGDEIEGLQSAHLPTCGSFP